MMKHFDYHTHRNKTDSCLSCTAEELQKFSAPLENQLFSLQYHPWHLPENFDGLPDFFIEAAKSDKVYAIGEIGLDRLQGPPLEVQIKYFKALLDFAADVQKPVILHIVRCHDEALKILADYPQVRKIWHGFRGKKEVFEKIVNSGIFVLLHPSMLDNADFVCYLKKHNDLIGKIGLESDDTDTDLEKLYTTLENFFNEC